MSIKDVTIPSYQTNVPFEIELAAYSGNEVIVEHIQTKKKQSIIPFVKGNGKTYFRYSSPVAGKYRYSPAGGKGTFTIRPYKGNNILYWHGAVTISANDRHLSHADGTPFFWLSDTWWYGATNRARLHYEFAALLAKRKKQHFSVVQLVVGIPPEIDARSKESENSGGKPFLKDWSINPQYFDELDKKIHALVQNGFVPCITGGWGHHIDWMGIEGVKNLWREIVARYSAYPVVFCLTGEVDAYLVPPTPVHKSAEQVAGKMKKHISPLLWKSMRRIKFAMTRTLTESYNELLQKRLKKWQSVGTYSKQIDPFHRVLTVHVSGKTTAYDLFGYQNNMFSMNTIQSGHSKDSVPFMVHALTDSYGKNIPLINLEPWYEGILGNFNDYYQRMAFWISILCGAVGHSYGAHGIWQMAQRGDGFMKHWGKSSWKESLQFQGAEQLGRAKQFLVQYEWWKMKPAFPIIDPHWDKEHADYPIAGKIDNKNTFIYFPNAALPIEFTIRNLNRTLPYSALYINPATMKIAHSCIISKKNSVFTIPHKLRKGDLLLVMKGRIYRQTHLKMLIV